MITKNRAINRARGGLYFLVFSLVLLLAFREASARPVTFEKEYSYPASEADSKLTSRGIALEQVKRLLLEGMNAPGVGPVTPGVGPI